MNNKNVNGINNLIDLVLHQADHCANKTLYTLLPDGEAVTERLTFHDLCQHAKAVAAQIQNYLSAGDRALLLFTSSTDFIKAFFGCIFAGVVAVPLSVPRSRNADTSEIMRIATNANAKAVITTASLNSAFSLPFQQCNSILLDDVEISHATVWQPVSSKSNDLLFLQYTSGSTGSPKGVMVSHGNILHNQKLIQQGFGITSDTTVVSWLPHYHDMGLIGGILQPLYAGAQVVLLPPMSFLQKPSRWLQAVSDFQADVSGGPNFAYELCVKRITDEQMKTLDLSCWKVAFNGAERVRAETMERFINKFKHVGFIKRFFYPTYGLAEGTLFVTGSDRSIEPNAIIIDQRSLEKNAVEISNDVANDYVQTITSCGVIKDDQLLVVVDEKQQRCPCGKVGEIWIAGESVSQGYWNNDEKTKEIFDNYLVDGQGPFLNTGDLGFIHQKNLFIVGRSKDLIIINGRNIYPEDIELTAQKSHSSCKIGGGAAFSIEKNAEEHLVLIQELERTEIKSFNQSEAIQAISKAINQLFNIVVHKIIFVGPHSLPKTTSGKTRRQLIKKIFLDDDGFEQIIEQSKKLNSLDQASKTVGSLI
jgi:acyl-CoA synthetase (AMP-forming)/AMP-acid ligase II